MDQMVYHTSMITLKASHLWHHRPPPPPLPAVAAVHQSLNHHHQHTVEPQVKSESSKAEIAEVRA